MFLSASLFFQVLSNYLITIMGGVEKDTIANLENEGVMY